MALNMIFTNLPQRFCSLFVAVSVSIIAFSAWGVEVNGHGSEVRFLFKQESSFNGTAVNTSSISEFITYLDADGDRPIASIGTKKYCYHGIYGIAIGQSSGTSTAGTLTLNLASDFQEGINEIVIEAVPFFNSKTGEPYEATLSINDSEAIDVVGDEPGVFADYTFPQNPTETLSKITIKSSKRVYIHALRIIYENETMSVIHIESDLNDAPQIYNIQGQKVASENLPTGIYIVKQGNHASKILVK